MKGQNVDGGEVFPVLMIPGDPQTTLPTPWDPPAPQRGVVDVTMGAFTWEAQWGGREEDKGFLGHTSLGALWGCGRCFSLRLSALGNGAEPGGRL